MKVDSIAEALEESVELDKLAALPGLIPDGQGVMLAKYAAQVPPSSTIVEIGSYKGKSTCYLAYGAGRHGAKVWAIDPWYLPGNVDGVHGFAQKGTRDLFDLAVKSMGYADRIFALQSFSVDAAQYYTVPVGLLYIDGNHREAAVREDFEVWKRHLIPGAYVIFDDLDTPRNPGVRVVVDEVVATQDYQWWKKEGRCAVFRMR